MNESQTNNPILLLMMVVFLFDLIQDTKRSNGRLAKEFVLFFLVLSGGLVSVLNTEAVAAGGPS